MNTLMFAGVVGFGVAAVFVVLAFAAGFAIGWVSRGKSPNTAAKVDGVVNTVKKL